jgi:glycolate oxidase iron-sulfur subunit
MQQLSRTGALLRLADGGGAAGSSPPGPDAPASELLRLADQCVKCGYCLPHCPTFRLRHDEAESPRGRIALIQGWLGGQLAEARGRGTAAAGRPGDRADAHLANCLECRACEPACPSLVRFGPLMDGARALREARRPAWQRRLRLVWLSLLSQPRWLPALAAGAALYRGLGLAALLRRANRREHGPRWPRLAALTRLAPAMHRPRRVAAASQAAADVALFLGCLSRSVEQPVAVAALSVLERLGIAVTVPDGQACCGAMHRHNGYPAEADHLRGANAAAFAGRTAVGFSSACVAELAEDPDIVAVELCRFLLELHWPPRVRPAPLDATIAVHEPCSHRNVLRDSGAVYRLLARIPDARVLPLPGNDTCCGAAGTYIIEQAQTAVELARPKIEALRRLAPDVLVTTNTGCALHLRSQAREAGLYCEVLHPVELLARQLSRD